MKFTKNTIYRAFRTFIQSSLAYIIVNATLIDFSSSNDALKSALIGLLLSSIAAGLTAIMNLEGGNTYDNG